MAKAMQLNICSHILIVIITGVMYPFGKRVNSYRYCENISYCSNRFICVGAYKSSALYLFKD